MKGAELKRMCEEALSGLPLTITEYIVDTLDDNDEIDSETFEERVQEELDCYFTYYCDAWDYLQDNNITDFSDAYCDWGVTDICAIACYYARQEVIDEVNRWWDEYEDSLESDEEDDDID